MTTNFLFNKWPVDNEEIKKQFLFHLKLAALSIDKASLGRLFADLDASVKWGTLNTPCPFPLIDGLETALHHTEKLRAALKYQGQADLYMCRKVLAGMYGSRDWNEFALTIEQYVDMLSGAISRMSPPDITTKQLEPFTMLRENITLPTEILRITSERSGHHPSIVLCKKGRINIDGFIMPINLWATFMAEQLINTFA